MISDVARTYDPLEGVSDEMLARLSDFIAAHMGLYFPRNKWRNLVQGISSAARQFGFEDPEPCIRWIMSSPLTRKQVEVLASHLTVGETYFLREKRCLEILKENILPELVKVRGGCERCLRIWSAGCSSGEEPYSMAILLKEMGATFHDWSLSIIATDINPHALRKATDGIYSEWSFRETPPHIKERYFNKTGDGRFEILPSIRKMVSFSYLNLVDDVYPSLLNNTNAMDLIFCRNVLMYFTPDCAKKVVNGLYRSLVDGGWLIVSPCEASQLLFSQFKSVTYPDAILYRKLLPPFRAEIQTSAPVCQLPIECPPLRTQNLRSPDPLEAAVALYEQGCYAETENRLAVLTATNQETVKAKVLLCRIRANQGRLTEARELLEQALAVDKLKADLHYLLAMILQEQGALEEATASLKRALYLDQDMVLAHFSLGNLAVRQGRQNEARRHFANTLELLVRYGRDEILPETEGISAGRLMEIIKSMEF